MSVSDGRVDVLVVGTSAPDLAGLRATLGEQLEGVIQGFVVRSKITGFGPGVSAANTARGIAALSPRAVVQLGTAGVYPGLPALGPGVVVLPGRIHVYDHGVALGQASFPAPLRTVFECNEPLRSAIGRGPAVFPLDATAGASSVTDDRLAAHIGIRFGAQIDSPDILGPVSAAAASNVPYVAVLGATRVLGSAGEADARQYPRRAVEQAARLLVHWLQMGAVGLPYA